MIEIHAPWKNTFVKFYGLIELVFGILLIVPTIFALYYGEDPYPFIAPVPFLVALGLVQLTLFAPSGGFRMANGVLLLSTSWALMFAICFIPFKLSGVDTFNAIFESISGMTTTGITVLGDLSRYDKCLLIWRSMTQWVGGLTIVLIFLYFMPMMGYRKGLLENELSGSGSSQFTEKVTTASKMFIIIYLVLSIINFLLLFLLGVGTLEAMCLMFTTLSTGGFTITTGGMSSYSDAIQWVTIVFMFLGGTNFYLHYRWLYLKQRHVYRHNSEFRMMTIWFILVSVIILGFRLVDLGKGHDPGTIYDEFKTTIFTTISLGTTTGYYLEDYTLWPSQCTMLLMLVAMAGASSSSTSGGIKFARVKIAMEYVKNGLKGILHPYAVYSVKIDRKSVDDSVVQTATLVFMMYGLTMIAGALIFAICGYDLDDSFGLSIAALSNGGVGFGEFGPLGDYSALNNWVKLTVMLLMWIGRLEILTAVILLTPGFWKELRMNNRVNKFKSELRRVRR